MVGRVIPAPLWFVAALVPMVVSQLVRLQQSDLAAWIFWDYAGRLGALAVLGAIPAARKVAFRHERLRITGLELVRRGAGQDGGVPLPVVLYYSHGERRSRRIAQAGRRRLERVA
jgi:hypothetical protein